MVDWHSSVHGHWLLVRMLNTSPDKVDREAIVSKLNQSFTADNVAGVWLWRVLRAAFAITILPTPGLEERKDRREASTDKVLPAPGVRELTTRRWKAKCCCFRPFSPSFLFITFLFRAVL